MIWSVPKNNVEAYNDYTQHGQKERTRLGGNGCGSGERLVAWMKVVVVEVMRKEEWSDTGYIFKRKVKYLLMNWVWDVELSFHHNQLEWYSYYLLNYISFDISLRYQLITYVEMSNRGEMRAGLVNIGPWTRGNQWKSRCIERKEKFPGLTLKHNVMWRWGTIRRKSPQSLNRTFQWGRRGTRGRGNSRSQLVKVFQGRQMN